MLSIFPPHFVSPKKETEIQYLFKEDPKATEKIALNRWESNWNSFGFTNVCF